MIAVLFEVIPHATHVGTYFDIAADLKAELGQIDGFISIERFQSVTQPDKYLSLSYWRDERAIELWRNYEAHKQAQQRGREELFSSYRLRVANVVRDYGLENGAPFGIRSA